MRSEGYLTVRSHLTSGASVCPENTVTFPAGNGGQKYLCMKFSLKQLRCRDGGASRARIIRSLVPRPSTYVYPTAVYG